MRLIDADALKDELLRLGFFPAIVKSAIERMPSIDAKPVVHAKWENIQNGKGCCSNCHRLDAIDTLATHCRYCGAQMDGDGNG